MGGVIVLLVVIVLVLWVLASCIRIVPQAYAVVLERLGAYKATWSTGIHFKVPFIERVARRVNLKALFEILVSVPSVFIHGTLSFSSSSEYASTAVLYSLSCPPLPHATLPNPPIIHNKIIPILICFSIFFTPYFIRISSSDP